MMLILFMRKKEPEKAADIKDLIALFLSPYTLQNCNLGMRWWAMRIHLLSHFADQNND